MIYYANQNQCMNRAERRKNGIKTQKKKKFTNEELERIIKTELEALIHEPISESLRRKRYYRLQPLIEEYKNQKKKGNISSTKMVSSAGKESDRMLAYQRQRQSLSSNKIYQNINNQSNKGVQEATTVNYKTKKAIEAYQIQMSYTKSNIVKENVTKQKKGFFRKIWEIFKAEKPVLAKPNVVIEKPKITKSKLNATKKTYSPLQIVKETKNEIYNEFEKRLRDMNRYSKQNPNFKLYKNGRQINFEPRYLG